MLAGKLPAGTGAAEDRALRGYEIDRALIRCLAAPCALSEEQFTVFRRVQLQEALFTRQPLAILDGGRVGR
ncbi:hypothetical protein D3C73_1233180 [compost metagenome]